MRGVVFLFVILMVVFNYVQAGESDAFRKGSADYFYNQGNKYRDEGNIKKAIDSWTLAIKQDPSLAEAYYNRGNAYARKKMFAEAIDDLDKAIELSSNKEMTALAYYNKGLVYQNKGDFSQAIVNYTKATGYNPSYAPIYKNRAVVYFSMENYDKSWSDVHKAEELGLKCHPQFIKELQKASGRNK